MNAAATKLKDFLEAQSKKDMLRFILCGSVDDGKSTLIGRLLFDSGNIPADQLACLENESAKIGTRGKAVDFALLTDGLSAEREQGITIDVAYRYFDSERRKYIVADAPGHEQYTRNMATAASNAGAAILLVDATKGLTTQTRRHAYIAKLMGVGHIALAVNKMDLVAYVQQQFDDITHAFDAFASEIGLENVSAIPLAATEGENVIAGSKNLAWYKGPTLMAWLEAVPTGDDADKRPFRFPVQWVNRPDQNFRGYAGRIASGHIAPGDEVRILPGGQKSKIDEIITFNGKLDKATSGQAVTITLKDNIDISRGNIICGATDAAQTTDQLRAKVIWLDLEPMLPGRSYIFRSQSGSAGGTISKLRHKVDMDNLEHEAAEVLELNEIGECNISLDRRIAFDSYQDNRATGGFIIIDRISNNTVGAGMIDFALMRADNLHWQAVDVDRVARSQLKGHKPCVLWFTGLSGSGKSTIANLVEKHLYAARKHTYLLDGDNVRHGLSRDLGFKDEDRVENIRRIGEVAKLMADAGLFVLVSFISPFKAERRMARNLMEEGTFLEVFVDAPIEVCEARDEKGLYKQARAGSIKNFTGIDSPYERPNRADIHIVNDGITPEEAASQIIDYLEKNGFLDH